MAISAGDISVLSREREFCGGVVIGDFSPRLHRVAKFAAVLLDVFVQLPLVRIPVAVEAPGRGESESHCLNTVNLCHAVTAATRYRQVTAFQSILRVLVHGYRKYRRSEAVHGVTDVAVPDSRPGYELSLVIVRMTIHTLSERQSGYGISGKMTLLTLKTFVFAQQGKSRLCVVELTCRDLLPTGSRVALVAAFLKTTFVDIPMAIGTKLVLHVRKLHETGIIAEFVVGHHPVALAAIHLLMKPRQRELRLIVIEPRGGLPAVHIVTTLTVLRKLSPVLVAVAGGTIPA